MPNLDHAVTELPILCTPPDLPGYLVTTVPAVETNGSVLGAAAAGDDAPKEACGVFGVYAPGEDVARLTFYGLYALQHRGQESAGIATSDGNNLHLRTGMGLVGHVFEEEDLAHLPGSIAIGHTRYSTTRLQPHRQRPADPHHRPAGRDSARPQRQPRQRRISPAATGRAGTYAHFLHRFGAGRPHDQHRPG